MDMAKEITEEELQETEETPKKKGKFKLILIILLGVIGLGIGGGYFFYGDKIIRMVTGKGPATGEEGEKKKEKKYVPGHIMTLEPFIFNIMGNPSKFAKMSLGIELKDAKTAEESKKIMPAIRDKVLLVLGTKPTEVFLDVKQREQIKEELLKSLKSLFKDEKDLHAIYVTDIIIQ
jgi:flagellar FliL protein